MDRRDFLGGLVGASALTGSCANGHLWRMVTLQSPDIEDFRRLPRRRVPASAQPRLLQDMPDPDWQRRIGFTQNGSQWPTREGLDALFTETGTTAFLILLDGVIVDERYFNSYQRTSLCKSFSMSKSVLSALFGIAHGDGIIDPLHTVSTHLTDLADTPVGALPLLYLLSCTAGFAYRRGIAPWDDQPRMYYSRDVRSLVRMLKLEGAPGRRFIEEDYSPLLLGVVLEAALQRTKTAQSLSAFAAERLWGPMGANADAYWVTDRTNDGFEKTESGFVAQARDLARFGKLFLDGGSAGATQVIPRDWVTQCAGPPPFGAQNRFTDGYMRHFWWGKLRDDGGHDYFANGHFGQRIYISPDKRLVLVRLGARRGGVDWSEFLAQIAWQWRG